MTGLCQNKVTRLGFFDEVQFVKKKTKNKDIMDLNVKVKEKSRDNLMQRLVTRQAGRQEPRFLVVSL